MTINHSHHFSLKSTFNAPLTSLQFSPSANLSSSTPIVSLSIMKKKTASKKSGRINLSQKPFTPQTHTHIHIHSTSSSSPSQSVKQPPTMRKKIAHKSSGRGKNKEPSVDEESSQTSPVPSPPPRSPKKATPHTSGKSSQKPKGFVLHETREPANLESLEFKNKFHKPHSHFDPSRFLTCACYEFHQEILEKRHICLSYLVNLDYLSTKGIILHPLFDNLKWTPLLHIHKMVYPKLVRQFYANLRMIDGALHSYVKRVHMVLNSETISAALGYTDEGPRVYMNDKWDDHVGMTYKQILFHICANMSGLDGTVPTHKALGPTNSLLHHIITLILTPQSGSHNRVTVSDSLIIFALVTSTPISFAYLMIRHMWDCVRSTKKANLPYGMFLTCIFEYYKVDLTNESVENKTSMIKGGGAVKGTKSKKPMPMDSDLESQFESSKATKSSRKILTEFSNMSTLMIQFHKAARKLASDNERAWSRCKERVDMMLKNLEKDLGAGSEENAADSDYNLSDD